jgi:chromosome segregation ATPase
MASTEVINALNNLQKELDRLEPALQHIEATIKVTNLVKEIPNKHLEFVTLLNELDKSLKSDLVKYFRDEVQIIKNSNSAVADNIGNLLNRLNEHVDKIAGLNNQIESFHNRIEKINFPERLDKVDATVSGINIGLQNLQTVLLGISNSTQELRKELITSIGKRFDSLDNQVEVNRKENASKLLLVIILAAFSSIISAATLIIMLLVK